jgi:hypothetical protein
MKSSIQYRQFVHEKMALSGWLQVMSIALLVIVCPGLTRHAQAQVVYSGDRGGFSLAAGGTASVYEVQYGQQKLLGFSAVVDMDTTRRFGLEAEGRWLLFNNPTQIQDKTWMAGPRYHHTWGKFQVYGKGLVGVGQFTFPYNFAHGSYLVIAPGAGVDYRWKKRISFRLADVEYQVWPQFTYGSMTSVGVSAGLRYHIF